VFLLCRGIVHAKGTIRRSGLKARYERLEVVSGHSLVRATIAGDPSVLRKHFAAFGHPVLGDERFGHAASNRHFVERYGLDRAFMHVERVERGELVATSALAPELDAVIRLLREGINAARDDGSTP
jgi:23S rRNA-/tRNA-specific pseudouridylate synthase